MHAASQTVSKGEFAALLGVSPGRVSQYITERKIFGEALDGEGRRARIRPDVARAQLVKTLEPSQRLGANGARPRASEPASAAKPAVIERLALDDAAQPPPPRPADSAAARTPAADPVHDELAAERLKQQRIKTAQAEREEALASGRYMLTDEARREMGRAVAEAFKVMDQGLRDMSAAMAEQFGVPQRDAHHALTRAFREVRARAAAGFRDAAAAEPTLLPERPDEMRPTEMRIAS
jgi:DNA-binding transcriptional regulator YdaS (Cro superfamily)